jgi:SAM-dependent methyltransferase
MLGRTRRLLKGEAPPSESGASLPPSESEAGVPPAQLRKRVHGSEDLESYEQVGRSVATSVFDRLGRIERFGPEFRVLDFGTGCGRILRPLAELCRTTSLSPDPIQWYGTDIDAQAIVWCQRHLGSIGKFVVNDIRPPLPFCDQFFDFVFSISIFTHLPEDMQFGWLKDINRVLKQDGTALLSTLPFEPPRNLKQEKQIARGFHYHQPGERTEGLPSFYKWSFHTRTYIERKWSKYLTVESFVERGINNHQDLTICRKQVTSPRRFLYWPYG